LPESPSFLLADLTRNPVEDLDRAERQTREEDVR
jgi:hypothetical protein